MDLCISMVGQLTLGELKNDSSTSQNVALSPLSIAMALSILASGSKGQTLDQFLHFFGAEDIEELTANAGAMMSLLAAAAPVVAPPSLPRRRLGKRRLVEEDDNETPPFSAEREPRPQRGPIVSVANALWVDHGCPLKPRFAEIADTVYKAFVKNVDLVNEAETVIEEVNSWAERETKGLIKEVLSPYTLLSPPLCLASAFHFKAAWQRPFRAFDTRNEDFHCLDGETVCVPFMIASDKRRFFGSFEGFKLLKLPYRPDTAETSQSFSMYIFLPHKRRGLRDLAARLNADPAALHPNNFPLERKPLSRVWIPKMRFSFEFEVQDLIMAKGLALPFDPIQADFSDMVDESTENVFVDKISHKAFVEVGEKGTKAAAVTVCKRILGRYGEAEQRPQPRFVADHPFMFMIVEDSSKLVVFAGAVLNPALE